MVAFFRRTDRDVPVTPEPALAWVDRFGAAFVRARRALAVATGVFLLLVGARLGAPRVRLMLDGARTTGRVVGYEERLFGRSGSSTAHTLAFMPVVEFDVAGRAVRFTDWLGSSSQAGLHERVPIIYRRVEPTVAMIDRPVANWLPWAPIVVVGLLLSLDAAGSLVAPRRRASDRQSTDPLSSGGAPLR
jgi:hypothetical protein